MQPGEIQKIYNDLLQNKTVEISEEISDYDIQVLLQLFTFRLKKEHPFLFLQNEGRIFRII